jgi:hypothetical protein
MRAPFLEPHPPQNRGSKRRLALDREDISPHFGIGVDEHKVERPCRVFDCLANFYPNPILLNRSHA